MGSHENQELKKFGKHLHLAIEGIGFSGGKVVPLDTDIRTDHLLGNCRFDLFAWYQRTIPAYIQYHDGIGAFRNPNDPLPCGPSSDHPRRHGPLVGRNRGHHCRFGGTAIEKFGYGKRCRALDNSHRDADRWTGTPNSGCRVSSVPWV